MDSLVHFPQDEVVNIAISALELLGWNDQFTYIFLLSFIIILSLSKIEWWLEASWNYCLCGEEIKTEPSQYLGSGEVLNYILKTGEGMMFNIISLQVNSPKVMSLGKNTRVMSAKKENNFFWCLISCWSWTYQNLN